MFLPYWAECPNSDEHVPINIATIFEPRMQDRNEGDKGQGCMCAKKKYIYKWCQAGQTHEVKISPNIASLSCIKPEFSYSQFAMHHDGARRRPHVFKRPRTLL
jgi:hypothetical protein